MVCNYYGGDDREGCVWDLKQNKKLHIFPKARNIQLSESGRYYIVYNSFEVNLRGVETGKSIVKITDSGIYTVAMDKDNKYIYTAGKGTLIKKWDIVSMQRDQLFANRDTKEFKEYLKNTMSPRLAKKYLKTIDIIGQVFLLVH